MDSQNKRKTRRFAPEMLAVLLCALLSGCAGRAVKEREWSAARDTVWRVRTDTLVRADTVRSRVEYLTRDTVLLSVRERVVVDTAGRVVYREVSSDRERVSDRAASAESAERSAERTAAAESAGRVSVTERGSERVARAGGVSALRFAVCSLAVACAALFALWWLIAHRK